MRSFTPIVAAVLAASAIAPSRGADLAIEHVNVIPMTSGSGVLSDSTVLIRDGRIESITPTADAKVAPTAARVDARGQWMMPALADMHVHLESDRLLRLYTKDASIPTGTVRTGRALLPYVANGVLQITVLSATPETIAQRLEVETGRVLGPHIAVAAMIDGTPPVWPVGMTRVAATPGDGRQAVRDAAAEGYEIIKAYENLDLDTFLAICEEASKLKLKVIGHLPQNGKGLTERFFVPGFGMVAHAEEFAQQSNPPATDAILQYAQWAKRSGTWLTSTLTVDQRILEVIASPDSLRSRPEIRYLGPQLQRMALEENPYLRDVSPERIAYVRRIVEFNDKLIAAFAKQGVPIVAGTDALVPGVVPGFSLHDELEALAKAGLSNQQVLDSATRLPAQWLGTLDDRGVVAPGKRADLLLLAGNPLQDIKNTRRIAGVIVGGRFYSRSELDSRMKALSSSATSFAIHDFTADFWRFWEAAQNQPVEQQAQLWQQLYVAPHQAVFDELAAPCKDQYDAVWSRTNYFPDLPRKVPAIRTMLDGLGKKLEEANARFLKTFPDMRWSGDVYVMASGYCFNGRSQKIAGRRALLFGVDAMAALEQKDLIPTLQHELFHRYHRDFFDFEVSSGYPLWTALWAEGLATYVSEQLNPSASEADLGSFPLGMARQVDDRRRELAGDFLRRFESTTEQDAMVYFNSMVSKDPLVPARAGYQLGVLVVRDLAKQYPVQTLAHWSQAEAKPKVHAALERIKAARP